MKTNYVEIYAIAEMKRAAEQIKKDGGVINDHTQRLEKVDGLVFTIDGKICPVIKGTGVCANPINFNAKSGHYHWSTWSCRGLNVWWSKEKSLEDVIERVNHDALASIENGWATPYVACLEIEW